MSKTTKKSVSAVNQLNCLHALMLYSDNAQTSNYLLRLKILSLVLVATVLIDRSHLPRMITLMQSGRSRIIEFLQAEIIGYALLVFHFAFDVVFFRHS